MHHCCVCSERSEQERYHWALQNSELKITEFNSCTKAWVLVAFLWNHSILWKSVFLHFTEQSDNFSKLRDESRPTISRHLLSQWFEVSSKNYLTWSLYLQCSKRVEHTRQRQIERKSSQDLNSCFFATSRFPPFLCMKNSNKKDKDHLSHWHELFLQVSAHADVWAQ